MNDKMMITLLAALLPSVAFAQDTGKFQCSHGELQRRVEIVSEAGTEVPCSVHYYKDTENPGEQQVLWTAQNDASYCVGKATEFVAKLEGWGWDCGQGTAPEPVDEAIEAVADEAVENVEAVEELLGEPETVDD